MSGRSSNTMRHILVIATLCMFASSASAAQWAVVPWAIKSALNIYSSIGADKLSPVTAGALARIYGPNHSSDTVSVIDPATLKVVDTYRVGRKPQHVIPAWDLKTLWVANNGGRKKKGGSLTPIDPMTGKPGNELQVSDPYNMYFMPDGSAAIIVNEALKRLDFRDPHTMVLQSSMSTPTCHGINHADFAADGSYAVFTCEFHGGGLIKLDLQHRTDIRLCPDGTLFYVADMMNDGVWVIDAATFKEVSFIVTGIGAHGLAVSRDGTKLYVANRGSHSMNRTKANGPGSVTVVDFATQKVVAQWLVPGGGSPDMGNVSADGKQLWLSGRFDNEVYMFDTTSGAVVKIPVGSEPHGLTVWPQPGRYSLGHTGNMR